MHEIPLPPCTEEHTTTHNNSAFWFMKLCSLVSCTHSDSAICCLCLQGDGSNTCQRKLQSTYQITQCQKPCLPPSYAQGGSEILNHHQSMLLHHYVYLTWDNLHSIYILCYCVLLKTPIFTMTYWYMLLIFCLNLLATDFFFQILAHPVFKM